MRPIDIWEAYPDSDLLPYPQPKSRESGRTYLQKILGQPGDGLFVFCVSELCEESISDLEAEERVSRAISDLEQVRRAIQARREARYRKQRVKRET